MTKPIQINIERNIIPFRVGTVELEFDATDENMARLMKFVDVGMDDIVDTYMGDLKPEMDALDAKMAANGKFTGAEYSRFVELEREGMKRMFDMMVGEGTFDRLYVVYPDVQALASIMEQLGSQLALAVGAKIKARNQKLQDDQKRIADDVLAEKQAKQQANVVQMGNFNKRHNRNHRRNSQKK